MAELKNYIIEETKSNELQTSFLEVREPINEQPKNTNISNILILSLLILLVIELAYIIFTVR